MSVVKQVLDIRRYQQYIKPHQQRIKADAGSLVRDDRAKEFFDVLKQIGIYDSCKLAISPDFGIKTRVSGSNTFVSKGYSLVVPQARYGPELVVNGGFDSDTDWSKGTGWTISGGKANCSSAVTTEIYQGIGYVGKKYTVTYTVSNYVSGNITVAFGYSDSLLTNGNGTYSITGIVTSVNRIGFFNSNGFTGSIDNISVVEVLNSLDGSPTDATQTTSTSQPHLGNIIAPNERPSLKNQNGQSNYLTHPPISFAANEAWSVTTVFNFNGNNHYSFLYGNNLVSAYNSTFIVHSGIDEYITKWANSSGTILQLSVNNSYIIGKTIVATLVADGNGSLKYYENGILKNYFTVNTGSMFNSIFSAWIETDYTCPARLFFHSIFSSALTPTQVSQLSNYLMAKYPEIPSVTIGSQVWATSNCEMVATPMGNLIQNVTLNSNVEKITNAADREFSSDTGFWGKGSSTVISGGAVVCTNQSNGSAIFRSGLLTVGSWYKLSINVTSITSGYIGGICGYPVLYLTAGVITYYFKANQSAVNVGVYDSFTGSFDDISVQEIGWSGSAELYDGIYAQTAGTVEQKTYAAVKAAAMWCYYNNDAALGAIYGKLYNWYAVKLLQMDIDYYNAANPSTPWGWRVPADTDFNTLATTLGGASVAGGKMKKEGATYFAAPNTGADNSSGFSAIGGGWREDNGVFSGNGSYFVMWFSGSPVWGYVSNFSINTSYGSTPAGYGAALRLIKS